MAVPSEVMDREFISIPPEEDLVGEEGWETCGKWILRFMTDSQIDMRTLDLTWNALQPLLSDGTLLMLKSSTALLMHEAEIILCYVKAGKEEAERTARIIRATVDFLGIMYYQVNVAWRHGHEHVSIYMHTYRGSFYVRDRYGEWILDENSQRDVSIPARFLGENYSPTGSEELPSMTDKHYVNLPSSSKGVLNWHLRCRLSETMQGYLPEADRVWIVARELFRDGHFVGISWCRNAQGVEVRLHVSGEAVTSSQLDACDRIRRDASVGHVMYFTRGNERNIKYSYKYTAEGEFYQQTEFSEKCGLRHRRPLNAS